MVVSFSLNARLIWPPLSVLVYEHSWTPYVACRNGVELGRIDEQRQVVVRELTVNYKLASSEVK